MRLQGGLLAVVGLLRWCAPARGEEPGPAASLSAAADPVQPAHRPVLICLTVHNTGKVPLQFWWSGWADYPDAALFSVEAKSVDGRIEVRSLRLLNRPESDVGAVRTRQVLPGKSITFPAAFIGLPPRKYTLRFFGDARNDLASSWPATYTTDDLVVDIRDDDKTAASCDQKMLARVRADDGFAQFISANYPSKAVRAALLKDLAGDDVIAAERAMDGLWPDDPPDFDAGIVIDVLERHLAGPAGADDFAFTDRLLAAAEKYNTLESEAIVAKLAAGRPAGRVRDNALSALEKIERARISANAGILPPSPAPRDPAVINALLKLVTSLDPETRRTAYIALGSFPDDPAAVAALRAGLNDPDPSVQSKVRQVLEIVQRARAAKH